MLESPETIQFMSDIIKNPSLRDEVVRNADRAIAQLESLPGGFNALHRLHNQLDDPYESLLSQNNNNQQNTNNNQEQTHQQTAPTNTPLPNPWASNSNQNNNNMNNMMNNMNLFNSMFGTNQQQTGQQPNMFPYFNPMFNPQINQGSDNSNQQTGQQQPNMFPFYPMYNSMMEQNQGGTINQPDVPPEEKYKVQLKQLEDMGLTNKEVNIKALTESKGNVDRAISKIIGDM